VDLFNLNESIGSGENNKKYIKIGSFFIDIFSSSLSPTQIFDEVDEDTKNLYIKKSYQEEVKNYLIIKPHALPMLVEPLT